MGVDTECDVAVDAGADPGVRQGIRRIRDRLLGEHLGLSAEEVARDLGRLGTLRGLVDARADNDHTLVRVELAAEPAEPAEVVQAAANPDEPIQFPTLVAQWIPPLDARVDRGRVRLWLPATAGAVAIAVIGPTIGLEPLRAMFEAGPGMLSGFAVAMAVFLVAHLALVPLELLAAAAGLLLGMPQGVLIALLGSWTAAAIGYLIGRAIPRPTCHGG